MPIAPIMEFPFLILQTHNVDFEIEPNPRNPFKIRKSFCLTIFGQKSQFLWRKFSTFVASKLQSAFNLWWFWFSNFPDVLSSLTWFSINFLNFLWLILLNFSFSRTFSDPPTWKLIRSHPEPKRFNAHITINCWDCEASQNFEIFEFQTFHNFLSNFSWVSEFFGSESRQLFEGTWTWIVVSNCEISPNSKTMEASDIRSDRIVKSFAEYWRDDWQWCSMEWSSTGSFHGRWQSTFEIFPTDFDWFCVFESGWRLRWIDERFFESVDRSFHYWMIWK